MVCKTLNHKSLIHVDRWMGKVQVYTRLTKSLQQTALIVPQKKKAKTFSPSAKKNAPSPRLHPQADHIIDICTQQVKIYIQICPRTTSTAVYRPNFTLICSHSKTAMWLCWLSRNIWPPPTETNWAQSRKAQLIPYKLGMLFHTHLEVRQLCPQTYSLLLPLELSQVTHTPTSIKTGGAYKPENLPLYRTFARQLCDDNCLPGWLSAFPTLTATNIQWWTKPANFCI